jgi:hypothetical protein
LWWFFSWDLINTISWPMNTVSYNRWSGDQTVYTYKHRIKLLKFKKW